VGLGIRRALKRDTYHAARRGLHAHPSRHFDIEMLARSEMIKGGYLDPTARLSASCLAAVGCLLSFMFGLQAEREYLRTLSGLVMSSADGLGPNTSPPSLSQIFSRCTVIRRTRTPGGTPTCRCSCICKPFVSRLKHEDETGKRASHIASSGCRLTSHQHL
jgi:hypothetical protein